MEVILKNPRIKAYRDLLRKARKELNMWHNTATGRWDKEGRNKVVIEIDVMLKKRKF